MGANFSTELRNSMTKLGFLQKYRQIQKHGSIAFRCHSRVPTFVFHTDRLTKLDSTQASD